MSEGERERERPVWSEGGGVRERERRGGVRGDQKGGVSELELDLELENFILQGS